MAHVNQQVRDEFDTRLSAIGDLASVHSNRGLDLLDDLLPAAMIETADDVVTKESKAWTERPLEKRLIEVTVVLVLAGSTSEAADDEIDALRAQVEAAVADDDDLGGLAQDVTHTGGELTVGDWAEGEEWYTFLALTWEVIVWTHYGDPETAVS